MNNPNFLISSSEVYGNVFRFNTAYVGFVDDFLD